MSAYQYCTLNALHLPHLDYPPRSSNIQLLTTPKAVISNYITPTQKPIKQQWPGQDLEIWKKPADLKVVGLILFGRHTFVSILDCHLKVYSGVF
jgi:hypothetical protein